jgi:RNA polymerase-binding transcription factor DksA
VSFERFNDQYVVCDECGDKVPNQHRSRVAHVARHAELGDEPGAR